VAPRGPCTCGLPEDGYLLERIEGRAADAIPVECDGRRALATPALLDDAIDAAEPEIEAWQLVVGAPERWTLCVRGGTGERAARALRERFGVGEVRPQREAAIPVEGSGKYRLVRSA
jgi:hypothetical protein